MGKLIPQRVRLQQAAFELNPYVERYEPIAIDPSLAACIERIADTIELVLRDDTHPFTKRVVNRSMTLPGVNGERMFVPYNEDEDAMPLLLYVAACTRSGRTTIVQIFNAHTPADPPLWSVRQLERYFVTGQPTVVFTDPAQLHRLRRGILDLAGESPEIDPFVQFLQPRSPPPTYPASYYAPCTDGDEEFTPDDDPEADLLPDRPQVEDEPHPFAIPPRKTTGMTLALAEFIGAVDREAVVPKPRRRWAYEEIRFKDNGAECGGRATVVLRPAELELLRILVARKGEPVDQALSRCPTQQALQKTKQRLEHGLKATDFPFKILRGVRGAYRLVPRISLGEIEAPPPPTSRRVSKSHL